MAKLQILVLGFSTADAAERVVTTLGNMANNIHMTRVGPKTRRGSRDVRLLGATPEPAEARPAALIAGILDADPDSIRHLDDELNVIEWAPPDWQAPEHNVVGSLSELSDELGSVVVFRFGPGRSADRLASKLWHSFESAGLDEPTVITSFGLEQPATVTMDSIEHELASITGQTFDLRLAEGGDAIEISPGAPAGTLKQRHWGPGRVKWFNADKGFGFIAPEDGSADVFVHYSEIQSSGFRTLDENQRVEFEVSQSPKGPQVTGVRSLGGDARDAPGGGTPVGPAGPQPEEPTPTHVERYIEGRCQPRVKVGQSSWIAVQIAINRPKGGGIPVDLPNAETRVHAMLKTSKDLELESEADLELLVPPNRDTGWYAWQVRPTSSGLHQAVACFHHDGEVLAVLPFELRAGKTSGTDLIAAAPVGIDLRPLSLDQGLIVVRSSKEALQFIALDGANPGAGVAAVAQKFVGAVERKILGAQRKDLDEIARARYAGRSAAEDSARVRDIGIDLFGFLPEEIQHFLVEGLGKWESLKIETDDESIAWELLSQKDPESFFANRLPFLRWKTGFPPPTPNIACDTAVLIQGQELLQERQKAGQVRRKKAGQADGDDLSFEQQIEQIRCRLGVPADAVVTSTRELASRVSEANFDLLHYAGHMSMEGGYPSMHIGNGVFSVARIRSLQQDKLSRRPLVFLNACATNAAIPQLTGPAGWVEGFLRAGAGSFIGTNWTVRASTAAKFAEHFYDALLGSTHLSLALASALARQRMAKEEADWASLAYTVYGHPTAALVTK